MVAQALYGDPSNLYGWPPLSPGSHALTTLPFFSWWRAAQGCPSRSFWEAWRRKQVCSEVGTARVGSSPSGGTGRPTCSVPGAEGHTGQVPGAVETVRRGQPMAVVVASHFQGTVQHGPGDSILGCHDSSHCAPPPTGLSPRGLQCCSQGPHPPARCP